jgi:hypothetical protein
MGQHGVFFVTGNYGSLPVGLRPLGGTAHPEPYLLRCSSDVQTTGQVLLLARDAVRAGKVRIAGLKVLSAETGGRQRVQERFWWATATAGPCMCRHDEFRRCWFWNGVLLAAKRTCMLAARREG